jgi:hypothetical protein
VFYVTVLAKVRWLDFSMIFQSSHSRITMNAVLKYKKANNGVAVAVACRP